MPWKPHRLRDADVWARVDAAGELIKDADGRVEIVYKAADGAKVYRAGARNLTPLPGAPIDFAAGERAPEKPKGGAAAVPEDAIHVWTDGACSGNPGPCGIGVVVIDGKEQKETSEYLGQGTNNIAELTAILRGLQQTLDRKQRTVVIYSDSAYSIGLLTQAWKAKANKELVEELRALTRQFPDLRFVKVAGHAGIPLNERVDYLATTAVSRRR